MSSQTELSTSILNYNKNNISKILYYITTSTTTTRKSTSRAKQRTLTSTYVLGTLLPLLLLINISCVECLMARDRNKNSHLEAKVGSYVVFNCHIDFPYDFPIPFVVHWSKDNKKIFTWFEGEASTNELFNGRLKLVHNDPEYGKASANLTAIRESDQGSYHCQIIFPNRSPNVRNNGTLYQLTVQGGSLIKIPPVNQTLMEGQTAFFHCVMKYPDTSVVSWHKDGALLQDIADLVRRSYIGPDGSLSVDPTMMSDLGEYECRVQSSEGEIQTAKAFLNIQYKAKVIYAPPEVYLPYGQSAVLDCHFRANPPLKKLRWEKDGLLFDSYNVPGVFNKMNGSLYFAKVDENHAGSYTCTPYNDLGTDGPSPVISVIVLRPPIFTVTPKAIYIQKLAENAELPCVAIDRDGNNRPTIMWSRRNGLPLPPERHRMTGGNLTIEHLIESDRGMYECSATNEAATVTVETELMIENIAPRPPYNLTANSTETAITIRWHPGYLRPNLEYTVWYRMMEAPEWRTLRVLQKNAMEATIHNLVAGHEYEFMILSQDKYGDGMFSKQFRFSTQAGAQTTEDYAKNTYVPTVSAAAADNNDISRTNTLNPLLPSTTSLSEPWNLSVINNQQGWLLHWEHPQKNLDQLRLYTVRWWKEPEHYLIGTLETFENYYQLRHLPEDSSYKIQVLAVSVDGVKVPSHELIIDVPSQRKTRAILIGSSVGVAFLLCALCVVIYVKRSCLRHLFAPRNVDDDDDEAPDGDACTSGDCEEINRQSAKNTNA